MRRPALLLSVLGSLVVAPGSGEPPVSRGTLFIVGGGEQTPEMVARFVTLAGGAGRAVIAVVPMASGEPQATGQEKAEELDSLGAKAFVLTLTREQALTDSAAQLLDSVTGIWFTGGDQARLTAILLGTRVLRLMHERYRAGAVVGGTSAGAAIMPDSMITGNQYRPPPDTNGYYGDDFPRLARRSIEIVPGLGFLTNAIVDQHFIRRERHNRLLSVVLERPTLLGVGIDESTALEVRPDGTWRVSGVSAAIIYDARHARISRPGAHILGATGVTVTILPAGGSYNPKTGRAILPGP